MRARFLAPVVAAIVLGQATQPETLPRYAAATYVEPGHDFTVFPLTGEPVVTSIPQMAWMTTASDGKTIYGVLRPQKGIQKVDLISGRISPLPGTEAFSVWAFDVSPKGDAIALFYAVDRSLPQKCQLVVLSLPSGQARAVGERTLCYLGSQSVSVSADRKRLLTEEGTGTRLVDLETGSTKHIDAYRHAAYSPDGNWIAAFTGKKLELLDAASFRHIRSLGNAFDERPTWSPDSRYLLVAHPACDAYFFSLSALDIYTRKRTEIKSSHCRAMLLGKLWVSHEAYQALAHANARR